MTTPSEEYRLISLTQGQFALIDIADYEWLMQWKWHAWWNQFTKSFYARRSETIGINRQAKIQMQRQILELPYRDPRLADHINHNTLDNRRQNLRIVDRFQNGWNRKPSEGRERVMGTKWNPRKRRWRADAIVHGTRYYFGSYKTQEEAGEAYREGVSALHGEFAFKGLDTM